MILPSSSIKQNVHYKSEEISGTQVNNTPEQSIIQTIPSKVRENISNTKSYYPAIN